MILRVTKYGEPILRKVGAKISNFDDSLAQLADDMVETMYDEEGIGLAAQQIGKALQLFVVDVRPPEGTEIAFSYSYNGRQPPLDLFMPMAICNPKITIIDAHEDAYEEGCLSFPGVNGKVDRPIGVRCEFQDVQGNPHVIEADGLLVAASSTKPTTSTASSLSIRCINATCSKIRQRSKSSAASRGTF